MRVRHGGVVCGVLVGLVIAASTAAGADWPQWRGAKRDGTSSAKGLAAKWKATAPRVVWKARVGTGFSSIAVTGGVAYTMGNRAGSDTVCAFDAATGKVKWKHTYRCELAPLRHEGGPFATPTVHNGRLYTLSKKGHLFCLDAATGRVVWKNDITEATGTQGLNYGFAASPLVWGKLLILNAGSAGAAVDLDTGKGVWKSAPDVKPGHASPIAVKVGEKTGVLILAKTLMSIVEPTTGRVLLQKSIVGQGSRIYKIADPLVIGGRVFVTATYGYVCTLLSVGEGKIGELWQNKNLTSKVFSPVLVDGHIVGGHLEKSLRCIDPANGKIKWEQGFAGNVIVAGDSCLILTSRGELILADLTGGAYKELGRIQALRGKCWTMPALSDGRVYCRNADGDLVCVEIGGR